MAKRIYSIGLFILAMMVSFCLAGEKVNRIPRVSYVDGDSSIQQNGDTGWSSLDVNLPIEVGDRIVLDKDGLVEIEVDDGSFIRANQYSEFIFNRLGETQVRLTLVSGEMILHVNSDVDYIVSTSMGDVVIQHRGIYRINSDRNGSVELIVRDGKAKFINNFIEKKVNEGKRLVVTDGGKKYVRGFEDREDEFDSWSARRDARYASIDSRRYIPDRVSVGVYDLDYYGRWVYLADFGYCWTPTVYVSNWAPYRYGYWRHCNPWGWTWVSYDPWGWLPYHYGRWWYSSSFGWVWVPGHYWGISYWSPGLVRFGIWNGYVGWVPLSPWDHYDGYWGAGFWGNLYHSRTTINNITNNYYNVINSRNIRGATYVRIDDFRRGRPIGRGVYSGNSITRASSSYRSRYSYHADPKIVRSIFQKNRIIKGYPKIDPLRSRDSRTIIYRGSSSGRRGRNLSVTKPMSSLRDYGENGRSRSSISSRGFYRNSNGTIINRGRPAVGNSSIQNRSRSRGRHEQGNYGSHSRNTGRTFSGRNYSSRSHSSSSRNKSIYRNYSSRSRSYTTRSRSSSSSGKSRSSRQQGRGSSSNRQRRVPSPGGIFSNNFNSYQSSGSYSSGKNYRSKMPTRERSTGYSSMNYSNAYTYRRYSTPKVSVFHDNSHNYSNFDGVNHYSNISRNRNRPYSHYSSHVIKSSSRTFVGITSGHSSSYSWNTSHSRRSSTSFSKSYFGRTSGRSGRHSTNTSSGRGRRR